MNVDILITFKMQIFVKAIFKKFQNSKSVMNRKFSKNTVTPKLRIRCQKLIQNYKHAKPSNDRARTYIFLDTVHKITSLQNKYLYYFILYHYSFLFKWINLQSNQKFVILVITIHIITNAFVTEVITPCNKFWKSSVSDLTVMIFV